MVVLNVLYLVLPLIALLPSGEGCGRERWSDRALQYNAYNSSMIHLARGSTLFDVDDAFSVCSWVKKLVEGDDKNWIFYGVDAADSAFYISDTLESVGFLNQIVPISDKPSVSLNTWHHTCLSWSKVSGKVDVYFDAKLVGSAETTSTPKVPAGSQLYLNWFPSDAGNVSFGGQLFKLQFYKTSLTSEQVDLLFTQGLCSDSDQAFISEINIPWEYFLLHEKYRFNVQQVSVDCSNSFSVWNLLYNEKFQGANITVDLLGDLAVRRDLLGEFLGHTIDDSLIEHLKKHHDK